MNFQQDPVEVIEVFISYRLSNGSEFASLIERYLKERGFSVFIDVEGLEVGRFDKVLLDTIKKCKFFLLILTPNALDRCIGDNQIKDWLHKEIKTALECKCEIIPILHPKFVWPDEESLPEDMRAVLDYEGIKWDHSYETAAVDRLERFLREAHQHGAHPRSRL